MFKDYTVNPIRSSYNETSQGYSPLSREPEMVKTPESADMKIIRKKLKGNSKKGSVPSSATKKDKKKHEAYSDQFNVIQNMWDYLGVTSSYKVIFINIARELDEDIEKDFFEFEINSLKKINEILGVDYQINVRN